MLESGGIRFEWDSNKAAANLGKHGVSFYEACSAFDDDNGMLVADPDHSIDEIRWVLMGMSEAGRVVVAVHCEREGGAVIRLISARRANRIECAFYAAARPK